MIARPLALDPSRDFAGFEDVAGCNPGRGRFSGAQACDAA